MKVNPAKAVSLFVSCVIVAGGAVAQTAVPTAQTDFNSTVLRCVMKEFIKDHISPRPVNDSFSVGVYRDFIQYLDPNRHIFLQSDLNRLQPQQYQIDEQLVSGSTAFFDSALSIFKVRLAELSKEYTRLLEKPLNLDKNEIFPVSHSFPVTIAERTGMWNRKLRMDVLKRYMTFTNQQDKLQPVLEAKARTSITKLYSGFFSQQLSEKADREKFIRYVNVATFQMDPHTTYAGPDFADYFPGTDGKPYYSLGLELENAGTDIVIKRIIAGSTADKSGVFMVNDRILAVEDKNGNMMPVTGMQGSQVLAMLSSTTSSTARLTIENQDATEKTVSIPREEVVLISYTPKSAILVKDGVKYGYLKLPMFYGGTLAGENGSVGQMMAKEIEKLKAQEVKAVILDLRGNPGGAVNVAQNLGGLFGLKNVMSITQAKFNATHERPTGEALYTDALIVMTDETSASASEMFAGAVQDEGRGIVIGSAYTYGKGTAQVTSILTGTDPENGKTRKAYGNLYLTYKKVFRGDGTTNQIRGLIPDIIFQEKMQQSSVHEKHFRTALTVGNYEAKEYVRGKRNFNYDLVVKNAQERIRNNADIQLVAGNMTKIDKLLAQPVKMNWQKYAAWNKEYRQLELAIKQAKESVDAQSLQVENSMPEWMNPNSIHPFEMLEYLDWLKTLGKDIYLLEAVNVAKDMVANPN